MKPAETRVPRARTWLGLGLGPGFGSGLGFGFGSGLGLVPSARDREGWRGCHSQAARDRVRVGAEAVHHACQVEAESRMYICHLVYICHLARARSRSGAAW